jgi:hypothetical protein
MDNLLRKRNVALVLVGVLGLLAKSWLSDQIPEFVYRYLGNASVSFSVYYLVGLGARGRWSRLTYALIALVIVQGFELADGFGIMKNVYDSLDYLANAFGILVAYVVDVFSSRMLVSSPAEL